MLVDMLASYIGVSPVEVERLLALPATSIYRDRGYRDLIAQLDADALHGSAEQAHQIYDAGVPAIKQKYGLMDTIMGGHTLSNWTLGFLMYPERLQDMLARHAAVPTDTIAAALPELFMLLDALPQGREEWQRALAVFTLPLLARDM